MTGEIPSCELCGGAVEPGSSVTVEEMMYGTGERFTYRRCAGCGSQILADIPADLAPYYPADYYSLEPWSAPEQDSAAARLRRLRLGAILRLPVAAANRLGARGRIPHYARWFAGLGVRPASPILDVGAGGGHLLTNMAIQGFSDLLGIDPFLREERQAGPVRLLRASPEELDERFEVAMVNHTLEHVPDPRSTLEATAGCLGPGGHLIVRVPAYDSRNARHYGTDWVHWDPPRHLRLPTAAGLRAACEAAGLRLVREFRDGHSLGFWGSEQYRMGIPLRDPRSWDEDPSRSPFSAEQIERWEARARELNAAGEGDAVTFVLARAG